MGFSDLISRHADVANERASDCYVTFGNSGGWVPRLKAPHSDDVTFEEGKNIRIRGAFEYPYADEEDYESYRPTVTIRTLIPWSTPSLQNFELMHSDRLMIEHDGQDDLARMVYRINNIQHDGKAETLLALHALGPVCPGQDGALLPGFPYSIPFVFMAVSFDGCADLDAELKHRAAA